MAFSIQKTAWALFAASAFTWVPQCHGSYHSRNGGGQDDQADDTGKIDIFEINVVEFTEVELPEQIADAVLNFKFNPADSRANGQDTISVVYEVPVLAWAGWAVNDASFMVGGEAIIGLPDTGEVKKYKLNGYSRSLVEALPDQQQTLIDASIVQDENAGTTTLSFTKILVEPDELPINIEGDNIVLSAWGFNNELSVHASKAAYTLAGEALKSPRKQGLWKAHGYMAAIAWGLFSPLAIVCSVLRRLFPKGGVWFQAHRALNVLAVTFTLIAFIIAVVAINQETPDGFDAQHFSGNLAEGHRVYGLVIFILAMLQAVGGALRPHLPKEPEAQENENENETEKDANKDLEPTKSTTRVAWEIGHRVVGFFVLAFTWYQVQLGIEEYTEIFNVSEEETGAALPVFWAVAASLGAMILGGSIFRVVVKAD